MYPQTLDYPNEANSIGDSSTSRPWKRPRLVDNEAQDSDEQPSDEDRVRNGNPATSRAFPQFVQLPPELRHQIWKLHCPDLSGKPRILEFTVEGSSTEPLGPFTLMTNVVMANQTKSLRAMLSTHHESRSIAVRIFPDELVLDMGSRRAVVRFRKETDVVLMLDLWLNVNGYIPPSFATQVQNLAIGAVQGKYEEDIYFDDTLWSVVPAVKSILPNLKRLYSLWPVSTCGTKNLGKWCGTEYVHKYMLEKDYPATYLGECAKSLFCWPDLDAHPDFARSNVLKWCTLEQTEETGLEIWSIALFERESCFRAYNKMKWYYLNKADDDQDSSTSHDDDGTDSDEFESGGINDDEIYELDG